METATTKERGRSRDARTRHSAKLTRRGPHTTITKSSTAQPTDTIVPPSVSDVNRADHCPTCGAALCDFCHTPLLSRPMVLTRIGARAALVHLGCLGDSEAVLR